MNPNYPGPGPQVGYGPPQAGPPQAGQPQAGLQGNYGPPQPGPMPGLRPHAPVRQSLDIGRVASALVIVSGVVVLFCSLLNLYSVSVMPGKVSDVNGTVEVGIGFYTMLPFNAPVLAMAIPLMMLIAAATALPGLLGRRQGTLVSAVSAVSATLLSLVLMFVNPLPDVSLTGGLARDASDDLQREFGVSSIEELVNRVVDVGPGAGLIIALVFGLVASAAAVFLYIRSSDGTPADGRGVMQGPGGFAGQPVAGPPPTDFVPQQAPQYGQQGAPGMPSAAMPTQVAPHPQQGWGGPAGPQ